MAGTRAGALLGWARRKGKQTLPVRLPKNFGNPKHNVKKASAPKKKSATERKYEAFAAKHSSLWNQYRQNSHGDPGARTLSAITALEHSVPQKWVLRSYGKRK